MELKHLNALLFMDIKKFYRLLILKKLLMSQKNCCLL